MAEVDGVLAVVLCKAVASRECLDYSRCNFFSWGILVRNLHPVEPEKVEILMVLGVLSKTGL